MRRLHDLAEKIGATTQLDKVAGPVARLAKRAVPAGPVKDVLSGTWLNHPLHPLLTDIPIGSFTSAGILDVIGGKGAQPAADALVAVGLLSAVPTAAAGLADWSDTFGPAQRIGVVHASANAVGLGLYAASLLARRTGATRPGRRARSGGHGCHDRRRLPGRSPQLRQGRRREQRLLGGEPPTTGPRSSPRRSWPTTSPHRRRGRRHDGPPVPTRGPGVRDREPVQPRRRPLPGRRGRCRRDVRDLPVARQRVLSATAQWSTDPPRSRRRSTRPGSATAPSRSASCRADVRASTGPRRRPWAEQALDLGRRREPHVASPTLVVVSNRRATVPSSEPRSGRLRHATTDHRALVGSEHDSGRQTTVTCGVTLPGVRAVEAMPIDRGDKVFPDDGDITIGGVAEQGWNVSR